MLALLLALGFSMTHEGRTGGKALLIMPEILPNVPVRPLSWFLKEPIIEEVQIQAPSGPLSADIYRPRGQAMHGAVILHVGVTANYQDKTLVRFSKALARSGAVVMVTKSQPAADGFLFPEEVGNLVATFQFLQQQPYVDPQRMGFAGFCVGASLSALAAADPQIRDSVAFLNFFGGYFDLADYVGAITTETMSYRGERVSWEREETPWNVLTRTLIEFVEDPQDRARLSAIIVERTTASERLVKLSPDALALHQLLVNRDPERTAQLVGALSPRHQALFRELSPRYVVEDLRAKVFVMDDREDDLVPYVESRRMADALEDKGRYYTDFRVFEHVRPERGLSVLSFVKELRKLFKHLNLALQEFL